MKDSLTEEASGCPGRRGGRKGLAELLAARTRTEFLATSRGQDSRLDASAVKPQALLESVREDVMPRGLAWQELAHTADADPEMLGGSFGAVLLSVRGEFV
jgi:hypothetical protein